MKKKLLLTYFRTQHFLGLSPPQLMARKLLKAIKRVDESLRIAQIANAEFVRCRICGEAIEFAENTQAKVQLLQHVIESCPGLRHKKNYQIIAGINKV